MYKTLLKQPIFYFIFFILVFGLSLQGANPDTDAKYNKNFNINETGETPEPFVPPISSSAFETNDDLTEPDKNNPSETAEIIPDESTPQGATELPKTSGIPTGFYLLFGFAFMGIGYLFRKE